MLTAPAPFKKKKANQHGYAAVIHLKMCSVSLPPSSASPVNPPLR